GEDNSVYSPLSVYMALAMLSEVTDGQTRAQILSLLGAEDIQQLRERANAIWNAAYCDDGAYTSILGNSLWLSDLVGYNDSTLEYLSENYYASSYSGTPGSEEMNQALQAWINSQTGGLLENAVKGVKFTPDTILSLCST